MVWGNKEKEDWFHQQTIKRSYQDDVVVKIDELKKIFDVWSYGALSFNPTKYPLYLMKDKIFDPAKKNVLITGGVHGYETSGVHGALAFMHEHSKEYSRHFNFICAPCLSPWGYETINRWNNLAIDPNRSFYANSPAEECRFFLEAIAPYTQNLYAHFDLHETTDTDNTVFRIALEQRDGKAQKFSEIPDGFYLVGCEHRPQREFQKAIIESVRKVTHIAPADPEGKIINVKVEDEGIIYYDMKKLFLCGGFSDALYSTTTEVYPDSPHVNPEICNRAQVAAICGGLDYIKDQF